jgi:hypothetical protein
VISRKTTLGSEAVVIKILRGMGYFKLITKQGIVQDIINTGGLPNYIKVDTLDSASVWYFKPDYLEKNDAVILVGYIADDGYGDPLLYVSAYYIISKNKRSHTKRQVTYFLIASIFTLISTIIYSQYKKDGMLGFLLLFSIIAIIVLFASIHTLVAYRILEKEIKKLL